MKACRDRLEVVLIVGFLIMSIGLALSTTFGKTIEEFHYQYLVSGRSVFVIGEESGLETIVESVNSTRAFKNVFYLADSGLARDICAEVTGNIVPASGGEALNCDGNLTVVMATHDYYVVVLAFFQNTTELSKGLVDALMFRRFSDGTVDVYVDGVMVGYVTAYKKIRIFIFDDTVLTEIGRRLDSAMLELVKNNKIDEYRSLLDKTNLGLLMLLTGGAIVCIAMMIAILDKAKKK